MDELWVTLEQFLRQYLPEVLSDLRPGCTAVELGQLEHNLNCQLPDDFKALYQRHNGQAGTATGLFCGLPFLGIDELYDQWSTWRDLAAELAEEAETFGDENFATQLTGTSYPPQAIKPIYINLRWIPFTHDGSGNHLGIDLDPDSSGTVGQVINFGRDEHNKFVIAPSLTDFVAWMLNQYQAGNYQASQRSLCLQYPENQHFLDIVPRLFCDR